MKTEQHVEGNSKTGLVCERNHASRKSGQCNPECIQTGFLQNA